MRGTLGSGVGGARGLPPQASGIFSLPFCSYVERYGLSGPCDEVGSVLKSIAQHLGKVQKIQVLTGTGESCPLVPGQLGAHGNRAL